jgi:hypothetical protein
MSSVAPGRFAGSLCRRGCASFNRIFVEEIACWQKQKAKAASIEGGETGAITFVQRFNAMLGCFVHFAGG